MRRRRRTRGAVVATAVALLVQAVGVLPAEARWGAAQDVPGMGYLSDVWCLPGGTCLGVGQTEQQGQGGVAVLTATVTGPVRPVAGASTLWGIACPTTGNCVAVGQGLGTGVVVDIAADGTPGTVRPVPNTSELTDVACPTATTCVASGIQEHLVPFYPYMTFSARFVVITNGVPGTTQSITRGATRTSGIDCPTTTRCVVVGAGIWVLSQSGGSWTGRLGTVPGHPLSGISCTSSTQCYASTVGFVPSGGGFYGVPAVVPVNADGVAGPTQILSTRSGTADGISCVLGTDVCTVVGLDNVSSLGFSIETVGGSPTAISYWLNSNFLEGVSCLTPSSCGIVGSASQAAVFAWKGPILN